MTDDEKQNPFKLLYQLSRQLNSSLDFEHVLDEAMAQVIELMNAERGFILLKHDDAVVCHVSYGIPKEDVKGCDKWCFTRGFQAGCCSPETFLSRTSYPPKPP